MKQYAVLYKKQLYNKNVILLQPYDVIEGITDSKNNFFLDSSNEKIIFVDDKTVLNPFVEFCAGHALTEEELMQNFPESKNLEEIKKILLNERKDEIIIGIYQNDKINICSVSFSDFVQDEYIEERNLGDSNYQKLKERFNNEDFTLLNGDELRRILNNDSLDEIKKILKDLMIHKETYQEKMDNDNLQLIYINDDMLQDILQIKDLKDIKQSLNNILKQLDDKLNSQQDHLTLLDFYEKNYEEILLSTSKERIDKILNLILENYKSIMETIKNLSLSDKERELFNKIILINYTAIEKILEYSELEKMINDYKEIYNTSYNSIVEINNILNKYGFTIKIVPESEIKLLEDKKEELEKNIIDKIKFDYLSTYQYMVSKIIRRNEQIDAILSTIDMVDNNPNIDKKQACLIAGTTGTGKTQTFNELKRALPNRPIVIVDTNQITAQGYMGSTIEETILEKLLQEAHKINQKNTTDKLNKIIEEDIVLAQHGIVFLDEIDKRRENDTSGPDVNGRGVIDQLLKFMDGTTYTVNIGESVFKQSITFDTSKLVVLAGGAFQEYFDFKAKKIGYNNNDESDEFTKHLEVNPEELVKYGLSSQFIGRFNRAILYPMHTKETLIELENNKPTSNLENKRLLFEKLEVKLVWKEGFIEAVAEEAIKLNKGGRSLNHIISRCLDNVYSEIKKYPGEYKIVYLDKNMIENPEQVLLIKNDNSFIRIKDIKVRNEETSEKQYKISQVKMDQISYEEVMSLLEKEQKIYIKTKK